MAIRPLNSGPIPIRLWCGSPLNLAKANSLPLDLVAHQVTSFEGEKLCCLQFWCIAKVAQLQNTVCCTFERTVHDAAQTDIVFLSFPPPSVKQNCFVGVEVTSFMRSHKKWEMSFLSLVHQQHNGKIETQMRLALPLRANQALKTTNSVAFNLGIDPGHQGNPQKQPWHKGLPLAW